MQRKSQISVFIIIGILIIAIFGFMYFITSEVGKIKLETQANQILDTVLATTPVNYYITLCLEEATKSALNISGLKGGKIKDMYKINYRADGLWSKDDQDLWVVQGDQLNITNEDPLTDKTFYYDSAPVVLEAGKSYVLDLLDIGHKDLQTQEGQIIKVNVAPASYYVFYKENPPGYPGTDEYPCNIHMKDEPTYSYSYINKFGYPFCAYLNKLDSLNDFKFPAIQEQLLGTTDDERNVYESLPKLCKQSDTLCSQIGDSMNLTIKNKRFIYSDLAISISGDSFSDNPVTQDQIEKYIASETADCSQGIFNLTELKAFARFNLSVGNITVNTSFGFNGVNVVADYPITIKVQDVEPVVRLLKFNYFSPVRYKYAYLFARWLAEMETRDLDFDVSSSDDWTRSPWFKKVPKFRVIVSKPADLEGDTVVEIIDDDEMHYLKGGPFRFDFVIQNRPPVLDYIPEYDDRLDLPFLSKKHDIYVEEKSTVEIHPRGYDPDNDTIEYTYAGWKEDYDEYFDPNYLDGNGCRDNPNLCILPLAVPPPHNWTNSNFYLTQNPSANYKTNHSDIGFHDVVVCVKELNFPYKKDCQNVTVLVDDTFFVIANMTRCYDDVTNNSLISVEDPVCLGATVIDYFEPEQTTYDWFLDSPPPLRESQIYSGGDDVVMLPRDYLQERSPIDYYLPITINYFSNINPKALGMKIFKLLVQRGIGGQGTQGTAFVNATAKACIPHRPPATFNYPSFPFNNINYGTQDTPYDNIADPFEGNHTCCEGNPSDMSGSLWQVSTLGKKCYEYEEYGCYDANFIDFGTQIKVNMQNPTLVITKILPTITGPADPLRNNIFKRTFSSSCDGVRGNICAGNVQETLVDINSCADTPKVGQTRKCEGCSLEAKHYDAGSPPSCQRFTDKTFESYVKENAGQQVQPSDNVCAVQKCSYNPLDFGESLQDFTDPGINFGKYLLCDYTCNNGICEKPIISSCNSCRSYTENSFFSYCKIVGEGIDSKSFTSQDYKVQQTIEFSTGACISDICTEKPVSQGIATDQCIANSGDVNFNFSLKENFCVLSTDVDNFAEVNYTINFNCGDLSEFETAAHLITIGSIQKCIAGNMSVCVAGACKSVNLNETSTAYYSFYNKEEHCSLDGSGNYLFIGVDFNNANNIGVAESCKEKAPVDPDSDQLYCNVCAATVSAKPMAWSNGKCCGDDSAEVWQGGTCNI